MAGTRWRQWHWDRLGMAAGVVVILALAAFRALGLHPWAMPAWDLWAYWQTRDGPDYGAARPGETGAFLYSPVFAQAIHPLAILPWPAFAALWTVLAAAPLLWLAGRWSLPMLLVPPVALTFALGQLELAFAAVAIVGLRWPAVWALPLLTKVTPGVGLVWFAARGEWRRLGIALAVSGGLAAASFLAAPADWAGWLALLARMEFPTPSDRLIFLDVPLWLRLPAAAALVAWGARRDRPWVVPVGVLAALPTIWVQAPSILVALLPIGAAAATSPAGRWLRARGLVAGAPADPAVAPAPRRRSSPVPPSRLPRGVPLPLARWRRRLSPAGPGARR